MIRRLVKGVLRRVIADSPHIPSAPSTGRERPSRGQAPPPPSEQDRGAAPDEAPDGASEEEDDGSEVELSVEELLAWREEGRALVVLDIREPHELWSGAPEEGWLVPMNQIPPRLAELPRDRAVVVVCAAGVRSFGVAHYLREQGLADAWSLSEGFGALVSAGWPYHQPPSKAPLRLTQAVDLGRLTEDLRPEGVERGTVQRLREVEGTLCCDVLVALPDGGARLLRDLPVSELRPA